jgi:hypothetical protein
MTAIAKYLGLIIFSCSFQQQVEAQPSFASSNTFSGQNCKPPLSRQLFHDYVDDQQKNILKADGKFDNQFTPSANEEINFLLNQAATTKIDALQCLIETDSTLNDQTKKKYLKGLKNVLSFYVSNIRSRKIAALNLPEIITAYEKSFRNDKQGQSIEPIIRAASYEVGYSIVKGDNETFTKNSGFQTSQHLVVLKYCELNPAKTFATLSQNPDMPFADSLVRMASKKYPKQLYDYAAANNKLGTVIRNITDDKFIASIVKMARSKNGQQYFPFLDNIVNDKMSFEEIDKAKDDSLLYYQLLVKTQMEYVRRSLNKDTAFEFASLTKRMEDKAKAVFITTINGLHNENAEVRFRSIQPLSAQELYYLAVSSDGSIYTSSFVRGVFPLMMKKIDNRGDSLLMSVNFDKYRKLIKMSAGYNTLGTFLSSFPKADKPGDEDPAKTLMKAFVKNLEKSKGPEDAVDVADSYASIAETLKPLADEMLKNVKHNYTINLENNNKNGIAIYNILHKLFLSADSTQKIDLTKELGIPPVYEVPYKALVNDSGRVIMQQFFYGDKDGMGVFNGFVKQFSNSNWKITGKDKWIEVRSVKGKPVTIYANRALPEEGGEDEKAQAALCEYLEKNKLYPTVTIHRGHSYYADATIEQMAASSKIVFLGSCGGYHLLHSVLEVAPDAHIIASKQIGATEVNRPFITQISEAARNGNDVKWLSFWAALNKLVGNVPEFADYIPPYKNLGALFIKAYKIAMEE